MFDKTFKKYNVKKNFGFGCMRLPMKGEQVDTEEFTKMIDAFMDAGFNYFDTAHIYLNGKSELAMRECLTSRYPRESYVFTNKLTGMYFENQEDIRPFFEQQLIDCGVSYFDFYLMHAQSAGSYKKYQRCRAYETCVELKNEGKIKHLGISFHDKAVVLEQILTEHPEIEVVQIQFNYVDYEDANVEGRKVYEVCRKFNKDVIVMEPVKGGNLVDLPDEAQAVFDELKGGSNASYAIRYAAGFEGVIMVLSGMGNMAMMNDNISYMKDFKPLDERESVAVMRVTEIFKKLGNIPCTACRYCVSACPKELPIHKLFNCYNKKRMFKSWNAVSYYEHNTKDNKRASDCIKCGQCENICPQHLPIRNLLEEISDVFDKKTLDI